MKLKAVLKGIKAIVKGSKEVEINGICADSRTVAPGNLFLAKKGTQVNGADFIPQALGAGAVAIVTDLYDPFVKATQIIHDHPERLEAEFAANFYGHPAKELFLVGVTGSKGKTTTSYMVHHLLSELKGPAGLMSTVETVIDGEKRPSLLTTHSAILNQKTLREMCDKKCKSAVLEVSSHGLDQGRVTGISFNIGIFTNLYPDHLDYHKTVKAYVEAKSKLFDQVSERAIVNGDSPYLMAKQNVWTFGIEKEADIQAKELKFSASGCHFLVEFKEQSQWFEIGLMGKFNVYNALATIGVGLHFGASLEEIAKILKTFKSAPGRLERVENSKGLSIFVDYSHSGPALENVLLTLREIAKKRIITVFGCGGNRDPLRRSQMAEAADRLSDISIITSDNPRKENPAAICEEIRQHFKNNKPIVIENREEAICHAISLAKPEDIVLIAGKGHEKMQIFADRTIAFDDMAVAEAACK